MLCIRVTDSHRSASIRDGAGALTKDAIRERSELEAELRSLDWNIESVKQTAFGWKATIRRGNFSVLLTGPTVEKVLEDLLRCARTYAQRSNDEQARS